jgi:hypothetical protein
LIDSHYSRRDLRFSAAKHLATVRERRALRGPHDWAWGFNSQMPGITVFSSDLITEIPHPGWA